ncbi:uncharacterized protein FOMMEDRAFT_138800 [Fomitiporia mediterranea MF3/22]|uniref:uncharacterized protein n=1 Tax=Fomitiporia mediterranea (strain MF3/22) TaxID=694068 RepID=UPI000440898A|nr:uncharacterized protein FOMMEDRAFT_138800 [Fomitiporia mediterranea MF3/22]EJD07154.1 hypothetical protein FOMMEDRAFT_138800 [Fomitiporia mediterranea MF3/22]
MTIRLSEDHVSNAFHVYLKSSLTQAKAENLLDTELLSSAEADIMITGPALCLYFAALRCTTSPPSVPLPRSGKQDGPVDLTADNCPRPFIGFLETWARAVPEIQTLAPEYQHDLARIICGLEPLTSPLHPDLNRIASELRAVAIEISQRRSFQDRYASDLQAALDAQDGAAGRGRRVASFVPPPQYDPSPSPSPNSQTVHLPPTSPSRSEFLSPTSPGYGSSPHSHPNSRTHAPAIQLIRETLYASLADVLTRYHHVRRLLKSDPPRAYFAAVALAILDVASTRTRVLPSAHAGAEQEVEVDGVLGAHLTLAACPRPLQPFMRELGMIGAAVRAAEEEDTVVALEALTNDSSAVLLTPRMDRVRRMLERGIGSEHRRHRSSGPATTTDEESDDDDARDSEQERRRRSVEGRAIALANRINSLALGMSKLRAFRDRQNEIFKILASVTS